MTKSFTPDQQQLLDELLVLYPGGSGYVKGNIPERVRTIAAPLIEMGCVERTEFTREDNGEDWEYLRMTDALVEKFRQTAAEKGDAAPLN